jgi:hypothetical protein
MEIVETSPALDVDPAEYTRLLGYPPGHVLEGRAAELAGWAQAWYREHGRPWTYARLADRVRVLDGGVEIDGAAFAGPRLRASLARAAAGGAFVVAISAGVDAEQEAQRLWTAERPDEYFFLEMYASAVVEHLTTVTGATLCARADQEGAAVLPHYSPGYAGWDISEQAALLRLIELEGTRRLPGPLDVLPSGALTPKKSLLAVFGVTREVERVGRLTELVPCDNCSFRNCQYRRAPYRRAAFGPGAVRYSAVESARSDYTVNERALRRWARERLSLNVRTDGTVEALFRYDGTTCTNMGQPLAFHYAVTLGPREEAYPIRSQRCVPAPGDAGHRLMCAYLREGEGLVNAIARERPLLGQPLGAALFWQRPFSGAGCYCEAASREHKWGLVLETIHWALSEHDRMAPPTVTAPETQGQT